MSVELTVPTVDKEVLKMLFGNDAVAEITKVTVSTGDTNVDNGELGYEGYSWEGKKYKVEGSFVLVNSTKDRLFVVTNLALYGTILYDNSSTEPIAFKLTGSVEGAGKKSFMYLKKKTA